jgi:tetratricopeptide (TPR) repeat protein
MQFRILLAIAGLSTALFGQGGRGSTTPPPNSNPTSPTTTNPGRPGANSPLSTTPFPSDAPHPILITGKVMLDDGTPPPQGILIERVCGGGRPHPEGYTDSKGHFTVTLGQEIGVMADASEAPNRNEMPGANPMGGMRDRDLATCEIRATFAGFRSDAISLAGKQYLGESEVGTIVLHRMNNVEGLTMSATSALAPKDAKKAYEKGLESVKKNKTDEAQKDFEKAVEVYPKYASAWFELGRLYEQRDHFDKAREAYNQSLAADSKYINPYERLYMFAVKDQKWQDVADITDKVLRMNPYDFPAAYYFNAVANLQLNKLDPAEKSAREAVKVDKKRENPRSNYILGIILAQKADYPGAADCLRAYLKDVPQGNESEKVRKQLAEIEKVAQAKQN